MTRAKAEKTSSIGASLTARLLTLIAGMCIVLSILTLFVIRERVFSEIDDDLREAATVQWQAATDSRNANVLPLGMPTSIVDNSITIVVGADASTSAIVLTDDNRLARPTDACVDRLLTATRDGTPREIVLPGMPGLYRVIAVDSPQDIPPDPRMGSGPTAPMLVVIATPMLPIRMSMLSVLIGAVIVSLLAIGLGTYGVRRIVDSSLKPLGDLAEAAEEVSTMDLERGSVDLHGLTDLRRTKDEVAQVGRAFLEMLGHVNKALAARQRSEDKLNQFVADASHELRNPLAAIRGYAEMTTKYDRTLSPDSRHSVERILAESKRMGTLVEDLLLLARLDSTPSLKREDVDLCEILLTLVSDARVAGRSHDWRLRIPGEPVIIEGDRQRLSQAVINLLANARVHTPAGTRVDASLEWDGDHVLLQVADNGPGLPEEFLDRAFQRFVRADAARARTDGESSTGLGLAIAMSIATAHKGSITAHNHHGAVFTMRLPVRQEESQPPVETS